MTLTLVLVLIGCESRSPFEYENVEVDADDIILTESETDQSPSFSWEATDYHFQLDDQEYLELIRSGFNIKNGFYTEEDSISIIYKP